MQDQLGCSPGAHRPLKCGIGAMVGRTWFVHCSHCTLIQTQVRVIFMWTPYCQSGLPQADIGLKAFWRRYTCIRYLCHPWDPWETLFRATSSLPIGGISSCGVEALFNLAPHLQQLHMLSVWIGCRPWNGPRLLIAWDKTVINNSCKQNVGMSRRKFHQPTPPPP